MILYNHLPKDNKKRKYIIRTKCCLYRYEKIGVELGSFICLNCEKKLSYKGLIVFTELGKKDL